MELRKSLRQRDPKSPRFAPRWPPECPPDSSGLIRKQGTVVDGEAGAVPQGQHLGVHFLTKLTQKPRDQNDSLYNVTLLQCALITCLRAKLI